MVTNMKSTKITEEGARHQLPPFSKYVIFSITLFIAILVIGGAAFLFSMQKITRSNKAIELTKLLELEKVKLETAVDREIAIVLKMASSPLIQRYFERPSNRELEKIVLSEIKSYRAAVKSNSIFWISDVNKMFYLNDYAPYRFDKSLPENDWYSLTLDKTETYNFNIIRNSNLNTISLRINAPVFNGSRKAVGIVGTNVGLSAFISSVYSKSDRNRAKIYFFNSLGEITGAENVGLISGKKNINEELHNIEEDILAKAKSLAVGQVQTIVVPEGLAAVISIPMIEWYAIAVMPDSIDDFKTAVSVSFVVGMLLIAFILVLTCVFVFRLLKTLQQAMESIEDQHRIIMAGINYASEIQKNLLPPSRVLVNAFFDYSVKWEPRDVVGGDIYWVKHFDKGSVLCVCDCTGHGTPGALLTMLVMSALESSVWPTSCHDTAGIIWNINARLRSVFNVSASGIKDGCDIAVLFIANDGSINLSSGHINVFICNGKKVQRVKGQNIFVGEGSLKSKDEIKTMRIPFQPDNKFYIASDGLFDQPGGENLDPFGYKRFERLILETHANDHSSISNRIWSAFEEYRGAEPRVDDFELVTFQPQIRRKENV